MCDFFSFIQTPDGNIHYFGLKERKEMLKTNGRVTVVPEVTTVTRGSARIKHPKTVQVENADSHSCIFLACVAKGKSDYVGESKCNKFEMNSTTVYGDRIANPKLVKRAENWANTFRKSSEFLGICKLEILAGDRGEGEDALPHLKPEELNTDRLRNLAVRLNPMLLTKLKGFLPDSKTQFEILLHSPSLPLSSRVSEFITCGRAAKRAARHGLLSRVPPRLITPEVLKSALKGGEVPFLHSIRKIPKQSWTEALAYEASTRYAYTSIGHRLPDEVITPKVMSNFMKQSMIYHVQMMSPSHLERYCQALFDGDIELHTGDRNANLKLKIAVGRIARRNKTLAAWMKSRFCIKD
jgi:hypothetical protein